MPANKFNKNLNEQIGALAKKMNDVSIWQENSDKHFESIDATFKKTIRGIETIRFNPFKGGGIGGNQSFATALIDDEGNGVVISSIYSRERVSTFAKPIKNWGCEYELSGEEKEVLEKTKANKK